MESVGGKVEAFYFTYGQDDVIVLVDADVWAAAAISLAVNESCSFEPPQKWTRRGPKVPDYRATWRLTACHMAWPAR